MNELNPDVKDFKYSDRWFAKFWTRKNIRLRKPTHAAQNVTVHMSVKISRFRAKLRRVRRRCDFQLGDTPNMDQTPLPFVLDDGKT